LLHVAHFNGFPKCKPGINVPLAKFHVTRFLFQTFLVVLEQLVRRGYSSSDTLACLR
jgi:hypothetical protein